MFIEPLGRLGGVFAVILGIYLVLDPHGSGRIEHWQYVTAGVMWIVVGIIAIIYKPKRH